MCNGKKFEIYVASIAGGSLLGATFGLFGAIFGAVGGYVVGRKVLYEQRCCES